VSATLAAYWFTVVVTDPSGLPAPGSEVFVDGVLGGVTDAS
jgi:hypothetical protein